MRKYRSKFGGELLDLGYTQQVSGLFLIFLRDDTWGSNSSCPHTKQCLLAVLSPYPTKIQITKICKPTSNHTTQ